MNLLQQIFVMNFAGLVFILVAGVKMLLNMRDIVKEFSPNGGSSLKDRVMKLEQSDIAKFKQLDTLESKIDDSVEKLNQLIGAAQEATHWQQSPRHDTPNKRP